MHPVSYNVACLNPAILMSPQKAVYNCTSLLMVCVFMPHFMCIHKLSFKSVMSGESFLKCVTSCSSGRESGTSLVQHLPSENFALEMPGFQFCIQSTCFTTELYIGLSPHLQERGYECLKKPQVLKSPDWKIFTKVLNCTMTSRTSHRTET